MRQKKTNGLSTKQLSRRDLLLQMAGIGIFGSLDHPKIFSVLPAEEARTAPQPTPVPTLLTAEDDQLLDEVEKRNFRFFWEQASPQTGLVRDRCNVRTNSNTVAASIAATGFGLTALCIAEKRGYIPLPDARDRVLATLRFLWKKMPTHRGFFYHFADMNTGERV